MISRKLNVTFLSSGNGGNLKFLHLLSKHSEFSRIELSVIADRECGATLFAQMNGIENRIVNVVRDGQVELSDSISQFNSDIIFTTIHKIIAPQVLGLYGERMLNLHYSKLPRYSGVIGMQGVASAIRNQDKVIGVTTHRVTSKLDAGPITVQSYYENTNDFKSAVNASFRIGCLQIWESLRELEGDRECLTDKTENLIGNLTVHHSRPISTLPNLVNESFWLSLSDL